MKVAGNLITIKGIVYGGTALIIRETWVFDVKASEVTFHIDRTLSAPIIAEEVALPTFVFSSMNSWDGAYQDDGGLAWFYLFNKKLDSYGVPSSSSEFWNNKTGNGLTIKVDAHGEQVAMD